MGRNRKRNCKDADGNKMREKSQKCGLRSVLRPEFRERFSKQVYDWCHSATQIVVLGSLLVLYEVNKACDDANEEFFQRDDTVGCKFINYCFGLVLRDYCVHSPLEFREIVVRANPEMNYVDNWPALAALGNAFNTLKDLYITNVKNNLNTWCFTRMRQFFRMKQYEWNEGLPEGLPRISDLDVRNATKELVLGTAVQNRTDFVDLLLEQAHMIGVPPEQIFKDFVRENWFRSIPIFINIQRQITAFHQQHADLNEKWRKHRQNPTKYAKPNIKQPPKIKNFITIPVHCFKMKHIRIDTHLYYQIARKFGVLKLEKGKRGLINISKDQFDRDPDRYWDLIFDMQKIKKIGRKKIFDHAIVTDSMSASLQFLEKQRDTEEKSDEDVAKAWEEGEFEFGLGMDTGVRTWNAIDRLHFKTLSEVTQCIHSFRVSLFSI